MRGSIKVGCGSNLLDRLVFGVGGRNEPRTGKETQYFRVVKRDDSPLNPLGESLAERSVDVTADGELIVREDRCLPDDRNLPFIDVPGLLFGFIDGVVHRANLIDARLNELQ